jgi:hypothetical protein
MTLLALPLTASGPRLAHGGLPGGSVAERPDIGGRSDRKHLLNLRARCDPALRVHTQQGEYGKAPFLAGAIYERELLTAIVLHGDDGKLRPPVSYRYIATLILNATAIATPTWSTAPATIGVPVMQPASETQTRGQVISTPILNISAPALITQRSDRNLSHQARGTRPINIGLGQAGTAERPNLSCRTDCNNLLDIDVRCESRLGIHTQHGEDRKSSFFAIAVSERELLTLSGLHRHHRKLRTPVSNRQVAAPT